MPRGRPRFKSAGNACKARPGERLSPTRRPSGAIRSRSASQNYETPNRGDPVTEMRPRWVSLTPEQREIAADLYERTRPLIDHGMSVTEALDAAAIQAGRLPQLILAEGGDPDD